VSEYQYHKIFTSAYNQDILLDLSTAKDFAINSTLAGGWLPPIVANIAFLQVKFYILSINTTYI